jgi:hypothetical protein
VIPLPAWYCPTITPALLIPPSEVVSAPGTLTVVNLKVKVGASAAIAAIMNISTNPDTSNSVLQALIVFPLVDLRRGHFYPGVRNGSRFYTQSAGSQHSKTILAFGQAFRREYNGS